MMSNIIRQLLSFLLLVLIIDTFLAEKIEKGRISGGDFARKRQFAYYAYLAIPMHFNKTGNMPKISHCGGSLIHPRWILTAASCFEATNLKKLKKDKPEIIFMSFVTSMGPIRNAPKRVILHPNASIKRNGRIPLFKNDVALVRLVKPYLLTEFVKVVFLPPQKDYINITKCTMGLVVGTGDILWSGINKSKYLLYTSINTTSEPYEEVKKSPTAFYSLTWVHKAHVLHGDFGGPFVCYQNEEESDGIQFGIVSTIYEQSNRILSIFENVEKHMDFIKKHVPDINEYGECDKFTSYMLSSLKRGRIQKTEMMRSGGVIRTAFGSSIMLVLLLFEVWA